MSSLKVIAIAFILVLPVLNALPVSDGEIDELGQHFQGDIVLTAEQKELMEDASRGSRTGLLSLTRRWPMTVRVPYTFEAASGYTQAEKDIIVEGLKEIEAKTCIRFVVRSSEADYVEIFSGTGCSSPLGKIGGKQRLSLQRNTGCVAKGKAQHEFIHALGYTHMQNHIDRDQFVKVNFLNIRPTALSNFIKVSQLTHGNFGTPYDYLSVMHYGRNYFTINGKDTLVPTNPAFLDLIGNRAYLTAGDFARINNMYKCTV